MVRLRSLLFLHVLFFSQTHKNLYVIGIWHEDSLFANTFFYIDILFIEIEWKWKNRLPTKNFRFLIENCIDGQREKSLNIIYEFFCLYVDSMTEHFDNAEMKMSFYQHKQFFSPKAMCHVNLCAYICSSFASVNDVSLFSGIINT